MSRPWVSTNLAISADGKITTVAKRPSGWTSRDDFARLLELRQTADALLIGRNTLLTDRMTLTVPGKADQPLRCVVTSSGAIPADHPLFQKSGGAIHLLLTGQAPAPPLPPSTTIHRGDLASFLHLLGTEYGVKHLHCEGGGTMIRSLAQLDAIDDFHLTLAGHTLFGGLTATTATGSPAEYLPQSLDFDLNAFAARPALGECFLSYRRRGRQAAQ